MYGLNNKFLLLSSFIAALLNALSTIFLATFEKLSSPINFLKSVRDCGEPVLLHD